MRIILVLATLAWAVPGLAPGASKVKMVTPEELEEQIEAAKEWIKFLRPDPDPDLAEPPLRVEVSQTSDTQFATKAFAERDAKVQVTSNARGTILTLATPGGYSGSANLTFKNTAPPMRFTMQLTGMPEYDLHRLSVSAGRITLAVGAVGTAATTK